MTFDLARHVERAASGQSNPWSSVSFALKRHGWKRIIAQFTRTAPLRMTNEPIRPWLGNQTGNRRGNTALAIPTYIAVNASTWTPSAVQQKRAVVACAGFAAGLDATVLGGLRPRRTRRLGPKALQNAP
jgi:hypothetical protein